MTKKLKIINVVGARPNFMKMAPIIRAMNRYPERIEHLLVHTGQHYDEKMSHLFFHDLGLPKPDFDLEIGSGSHAVQTAGVMVAFETRLLRERPDLVVVVGDVNSTLACTITAKKLNIRVAHVEAGLRSRDMSMPEEINRLCTDALADYLFTTDHFADENLRREGVDAARIAFVGNVMIDTLLTHRAQAEKLSIPEQFGLTRGAYVAMTMHRPSNVDNREILAGILATLAHIAKQIPILFPIHPRTLKMIHAFGLEGFVRPIETASAPVHSGIWTTSPLGYLDFLNLNMNARLVLTDSGGLQEETTVLNIPCITMRDNTERPITVTQGTNMIVGHDSDKIRAAVEAVLAGRWQKGNIPPKWDGQAGKRIVEVLLSRKELTGE